MGCGCTKLYAPSVARLWPPCPYEKAVARDPSSLVTAALQRAALPVALVVDEWAGDFEWEGEPELLATYDFTLVMVKNAFTNQFAAYHGQMYVSTTETQLLAELAELLFFVGWLRGGGIGRVLPDSK